jgi:hypothetical protein
MAGLGVAIYTDELIDPALAVQLRSLGYDAVSCHETGRNNRRISDRDQLAYAANDERAILTNNVRDFVPIDIRWKRQGRSHAGIVVYAGVPAFGELLRRVIYHLNTTTPEMQHDTVLWLPR